MTCPNCHALVEETHNVHCSQCGARLGLPVEEMDRLTKRVIWGTCIVSLLISGLLLAFIGYPAALLGMLVSIFWLSPRLFKVPPLNFYDNHLLNMSLLTVCGILLSCTVCVGGPIYLTSKFGLGIGLGAFGALVLFMGGFSLYARWKAKV